MTAPQPPRRRRRGTYRTSAIIGGIGLLVIVIRLVVGNSGGNDATSAGATGAAQSGAARSGAAPSGAAPSGTAPSGTAPSGTASSGHLTCAAIKADPRVASRIDFIEGGAPPPDVPVPAPTPDLTCIGTADKATVIAATWPDVTEVAYTRQLVGLGWNQHAQGSVQRFEKAGAAHAILVYTQSGDLVALYGPPPQG